MRCTRAACRWLRAHRIGEVIPERTDEMAHRRGRPPKFDSGAYRRRNAVERAVGWLKEARRVATRFEKLAVHYLAALELAVLEKYLRASLSHRA